MTGEYRHIPVMINEVLAELDPKPGEVVCDCTLGGAGHSVEMAKRIQPDGLSLGIDQDDMALAAASERFEREVPGAEHRFLKGNFGSLDELLVQAEVPGVDCFLFDIGVSSPQLDIPERGFSYHEDAPLDMRMDPGNNTQTAAEVINNYNEADLTRILRVYGDEKFASRIARQIVRTREKAPIETTLQLVEVIKAGIPAAGRRHGGHPARKTFQALRIEVNHELDVLDQGLRAAIRWANPGGRICVISYHSLEDRIVKHVFSEMSQGCVCPPDLPVCVCGHVPIVDVKTRKPLVASDEEVGLNPRARSALMRVAVKRDVSQEGAN
ncbi:MULTISPECIES: 16S rRNA (cytosine(1402)-N(4))-methyltransferase RsmH [Atopobiaceae]|uniref:Ribosomal RNA small subunit methyltransferase H n=1 Tax=Parafannyhessea umbonata TaxID=604330 RepID=A0A1H9NHB1_9ACTN|nr:MULTISPECIES: 16S rRNA (cytosine(1402)-N(4))-methyltransferase RsmH [Atopobiaceae]SEH53895.1 16S rRNA (cytosine1402-N4)-methyltransferase [Parafannyhessea umbonata]SER34773.1 16S rRNA (cytosine1402-N4)-methyltransferase [Parafannyhessea umbonata]SJZ46831.1 16S rRNA (cytosine1402-N4)-methyltransferase [Olsenella sp. KH1P3]